MKEAEHKRDMERRQALAEELKKAKEAEETQRKLESLEREKEITRELEQAKKERIARVKEAETMYPTPEAAIASIKEDFGQARLQLVCSTLDRVLGNLLSNVSDPKFKRISTRSETIQKAFVRTPGGTCLLALAGFVSVDESAFEFQKAISANPASQRPPTSWAQAKLSPLTAVMYVRALAAKTISSTATPIPEIILNLAETPSAGASTSTSAAGGSSGPLASAEEKLYCANELRNIFSKLLFVSFYHDRYRALLSCASTPSSSIHGSLVH